MKRHLTLSITAEVAHYNNSEKALYFHVPRLALPDWCLSLCLIKEGLIDSFVFAQEKENVKIEIKMLEAPSPHAMSEIEIRSKKIFVKFTENTFDYLFHFFLKYYRDGFAEVDHLDIEVSSPKEGQDDFCVIFKVDDSAPPVSANEAKKRLGLS